MAKNKITLKNGRIGVHGHRGSRSTHPENTFPGFEEAHLAGADFFEVDIHLSKDQIPMVFHDPKLSGRLIPQWIGLEIPLSALTVEEIQKYRVAGTAEIPTLESVLKWMEGKKIGINIEVKPETDPNPISEALISLLKKAPFKERVIIQSFDLAILKKVRELAPDYFVSCLFDKSVDFVSIAKELNADGIGPHFSLLTQAIIEQAHQKDLQILPWTVNEPEDWKKLTTWGVDGIITDAPRKLLEVLSSGQKG